MRASIALRVLCGAALAISAHHYALAQSAPQPRQWYEYYDEGVRAVQQQRWQPAVENLLAAQKARAQQSRRVAFYGDRIDAYVPDYYLGLAYAGLGRFAEADAAFQRVTTQKLVVAGDSTFQTFQTQSTRARTEVAALAARGRQTPVQTAGGTTASPPGAPPIQTPIQTPVQSPVQAPETTVAGGPAAGPLTATPLTGAAAAPPAVAPTQTQGIPPAPRPQLPTPSTRAGGPGRPVPARTAPAAVRATERDGIAAYFGGDYATARQILEVIAASDGKAGPMITPRARIYLAASLAAEVLVGARDRGYLEEARVQLAQAGPLAAFAADRRLLSPRILAALGAQP